MSGHMKGVLVEYALSLPPTLLVFDFNPESMSRNRSVTIKQSRLPGLRGGYDFALPTETPRVGQCASVEAENLSVRILLDASDRLNDGEALAGLMGVQPELDTLRTMVEPKSQGPGGVQLLASLGEGGSRAFQRDESVSVLLFVWGTHVLPVFLTGVKVEEKAHLPSLFPYRAEATLEMQVIEGNNPFYQVEKVRQVLGAALNTGRTIGEALAGLF